MLALGAAAGLWHGLQMREIFSICDRITVLRDGMTAGTRVTSEATTNEIITMMVGRELKDATSRPVHSISDEALLTVAGLTTDKIRAMTFELRRGEVLGLLAWQAPAEASSEPRCSAWTGSNPVAFE